MNIVDRVGKYLQPGRAWYNRDVKGIKVFSVHHDAIDHGKTADEALNIIFAEHKKNGWPGASYHYYIHSDGTVYQLNKHEWVTWVDGVNWDCIGIVLNGYFHSPNNNHPTEAQLKSLKELLDELSTKHPEFPADQSGVYGHRERAATACPGDHLFPYVKEYRDKKGQVSWGAAPAPQPQPTPGAITAQTRIPAILLNSEEYPVDEDLEVQAIASKLNDLARENRSLRNTAQDATKKLQFAKDKAAEINGL